MYIYYPFFYAFVISFFFDTSRSLKTKHRRAHELRNEIYVPSLIDFELKGKSLAWFPVQIKNGEIQNVGKLRWKKHRKCRYIEDSDCFKTGPPKRIYNAQEDTNDPNAGDGEDDGEIAYDDYDYYYDEDDEKSTSNADSNGSASTDKKSFSISKEITVTDTTTDVSAITVGINPVGTTTVDDFTLIIEDDSPPKSTTECPLTDDTEEPTVRFVPIRNHCRNRYHTYQDQYFDMKTEIINTKSYLSPASDEYSTKTSTFDSQKGSLSDEQSWQTTSTMSTTNIKYYTDDYYEDISTKLRVDDINKSTTDDKVSTTAETPILQPVTEISEIYEESTVNKFSSDTLSVGTTASKNYEWPENYRSPEPKPERVDTLSSLKDFKKQSTVNRFSSDTLSVGTTASINYEWPENYHSHEPKPERVYTLSSLKDFKKQSTVNKFSSDTLSVGTTASKNYEWPENYHSPEPKPERVDTLSSLKDLKPFSDSESFPSRQKTSSIYYFLPTEKNQTASTMNKFTKEQIEYTTKATECGGDYFVVDETDDKKNSENNCEQRTDYTKTLTDTRFRHIETPPYPKIPVDLYFPTCSGGEDRLDDILSPTFIPGKGYDKNDSGKNFEKKKEKGRKNRKHCRRKSTFLTTEIRYSQTQPSPTTETQRYVAKQHAGNKKDAKVVVRIPPSLSDIPVVVVRDPLTQKLSLSLIGAEQDPIQPKPIYYKPPEYRQMFPPPFSYNNLYSPNIPPFDKIYPYGYIYGPNVGYRYDKANYAYPKHLRFFNNYRWMRDTYEDDDEDDEEDKNSTDSEWEIYLTV